MESSARRTSTSQTSSTSARAGQKTQAGVTLRPFAALAEFQACVALQEAVWGPEFSEAVPVSLLQVATYVGGLAIGAFAEDGTLLGFVFGLTGVQQGRTVHWSHLLAVLDTARNMGLGRMLKERQRMELIKAGIDEMLWTFDPLIAKNAHLNLNVLGARVVRFAPDMYGTTVSPLHHGLATDRLVVAWPTAGQRHNRKEVAAGSASTPILTLEAQVGDTLVDMSAPGAPTIRVEIPTDFPQLTVQSAQRAAEWHASVRKHFLWSADHGYHVIGLHRDAVTSRSFYLLVAAEQK